MWRTLLAIALLASAAVAHAKDGVYRVGQRVITRHEAILENVNEVVENGERSKAVAVGDWISRVLPVYRVERVNADSLWLKAEHSAVEARVQSQHVIPYSQASDYFTSQIRSHPRQAAWYVKRGVASAELHRMRDAIADLDEAIRLQPSDGTAWISRGVVRTAERQYDSAVADLNEAIRLDPKDADAYNNRGVAWLESREYGKAIADLDEAIRLNPKDAAAYNCRAWVRATSLDPKYRDGRKACADASLACTLINYQEPSYLDTLAAAYAECGEFEKAIEWQEKANKLFLTFDEKLVGLDHLDGYRDNKPYRQE